jgi:hypothetical protein
VLHLFQRSLERHIELCGSVTELGELLSHGCDLSDHILILARNPLVHPLTEHGDVPFNDPAADAYRDNQQNEYFALRQTHNVCILLIESRI